MLHNILMENFHIVVQKSASVTYKPISLLQKKKKKKRKLKTQSKTPTQFQLSENKFAWS